MQASSLSLKGIVGELETTDLYIAGMTWYIDANNNGMLDEGEGTAADFNEDGTFKANTVYRVQMAIALSNDADEDGEDDSTGFYLPQDTADIPDFHVALADGTTDTMDKEYSDAMLVYTYVFPATGKASEVAGDIDGDGDMDTTDAQLLSRYFAGWPTSALGANFNLAAGDMDGDGTVTRRDAMILSRKAAGWTINIGE